MTAPTLTSLIQGFFTDRLVRQRQSSPQTIAAYRDSIRLLLLFTAQKTATPPARLTIGDLDAATIAAFLDHLDGDRHNSTATRNARLSAIHSFYRYALPLIPEHAQTASQVLAIPPRRHERAIVSYLTEIEVAALLQAPDRTTWFGRRDRALLITALQTGLRLSELISLTIEDVTTTIPGAAVRTMGKGRRERATPLTRQTLAVLRPWLKETGLQTGVRSSPRGRACRCLQTLCNGSSRSTPPPPRTGAPRSLPRTSPRTRCGIPLR